MRSFNHPQLHQKKFVVHNIKSYLWKPNHACYYSAKTSDISPSRSTQRTQAYLTYHLHNDICVIIVTTRNVIHTSSIKRWEVGQPKINLGEIFLSQIRFLCATKNVSSLVHSCFVSASAFAVYRDSGGFSQTQPTQYCVILPPFLSQFTTFIQVFN